MKTYLGVEELPACVIGGIRREFPNTTGQKYRTPGHEEPFIASNEDNEGL